MFLLAQLFLLPLSNKNQMSIWSTFLQNTLPKYINSLTCSFIPPSSIFGRDTRDWGFVPQFFLIPRKILLLILNPDPWVWGNDLKDSVNVLNNAISYIIKPPDKILKSNTKEPTSIEVRHDNCSEPWHAEEVLYNRIKIKPTSLENFINETMVF